MPSKSRSSSRLLLAFALLFAVLLGLREWTMLPDGHTHLYFLDIGQGDSALIVSPSGKSIVIDGGPDLRALEQIGKHRSFFNRRIDALVLSHPHLDHIASFPQMLKRYDVRSVVLTGIDHSLPRYHQMLELIRAKHIPVVSPVNTGIIDLGDGVRMELLWPPKEMLEVAPDDLNNTSVVVRMSYATHSALFTGDIEDKAERAMLASRVNVDADILKIAHHGSRGSSGTGFLLAVSPQLAIISSGEGNSFGHPRPEIIRRLEELKIPVRRTDREGTIEITW